MQEILDYVITSAQYSSSETLASAAALAGVATIQGAQYASTYLTGSEGTNETKEAGGELNEAILEEDPENVADQNTNDILDK